ncbi:hypothetical protein [Acaryochloris marina]|uniref:Uncharacterized protein n=1 Tax=Acaryochloris marina (strain MBIC 11017) TaxID=329726 RepID=B0C1R9_ACAM1|nr:hypothetical protein [Acaryochloris marina]ABW26085.1 hypothetical protein AM1_1045 [Acaryochloris marina MBIC11017]BDM80925.1 hypothetical protein AM10699_37920 [Acaryochloris marina MBIC10699]
MTELFQQAIAEVSKLSDEQQNAISTMIVKELEDEAKWDDADSKICTNAETKAVM